MRNKVLEEAREFTDELAAGVRQGQLLEGGDLLFSTFAALIENGHELEAVWQAQVDKHTRRAAERQEVGA